MEKFRILSKYQETDDIFGETEDEFNTLKLNDLNLGDTQSRQFTSPMPLPATHSPQQDQQHVQSRKESPSTRRSISEYSEETSVSSFDELDIGELTTDELHRRLNHRTTKASDENQIEEQQLYTKYQRVTKPDLNRSAKLEDRHKLDNFHDTIKLDKYEQLDQLNEIDEDLENFENDFEEFNLKPLIKKSLPNFQTYHHVADPGNDQRHQMKKFQSSVNLNSRVINKLSRIPSFSNNKLHEMLKEDETLKLTKEKLLQQYKEVDKQHKRTNKRILNMKKSMLIPNNYSGPHKSKKGLVQYTEIPETPNSKMRFNNETRVWEGNNHELMKFNFAKPSLIKFNEFKHQSHLSNTLHHKNMRFDSKNLKWINDDQEEDAFKDVPEFDISPSRQLSSLTNMSEYDNEFIVSKSKIARFLNEEEKLKRKLEYWLDSSSEYSRDYLGEIRKMVMDSE